MLSWLLVIGVAVVCLLGVVAIYMHWLLHKQKLKQRAQLLALNEAAEQESKKHIQSIHFIARAFACGQVESAEACLRLAGLLDLLSVQGVAREPYVAIDKMRDAIQHIPIKDQWLALSKKERRFYQAQMEQHADELKDFITPAVKQLESFELRE